MKIKSVITYFIRSWCILKDTCIKFLQQCQERSEYSVKETTLYYNSYYEDEISNDDGDC
jgi:hypothetical protein